MRNDRSLSRYIRELGSHEPLERDEEHRLALAYRRTRSPRLAERLVCSHLRLVVRIAREYAWSGHELLDLIEEGNLGLVLALGKFDPDRGVRLSSYAAWWIRATILHFIAANRRMVRIGTTKEQRKVMARLRSARAELERLGTPADIDELARRMGVRSDGLAALAQHIETTDVALDAPIRDEDESTTRLDVLLAADETRPDTLVEHAEHAQHLRRATDAFMQTLDPRDLRLFRSRWLTEEPPTLREMGKRFGVTRERARQLEKRLLDRFRRFAVDAELAA